MANPQLENGYISIANEIWRALRKIRIPGQARQILDCILEKTYGWNESKAMIRNKEFSKMTGIDRRKIPALISILTTMNLVFVTKKGDKVAPTYCFNKDYEKWILSPKKVTSVTNNGDKTAFTHNYIKNHSNKTSTTLSRRKSKKQTFDMTDWQYNFSKRFYELKKNDYGGYEFMQKILENDFQPWADALDKLNRIDKKSKEEIGKVIKFAVEDDFWSRNLLSLSMLRKKNNNGIMKFEMILNKLNSQNGKYESGRYGVMMT